MRSLYVGVVIAALTTLLLAYVAFLVISDQFIATYLDPVFIATDQLEMEDAIGAFKAGGPRAVETYMIRLDRLFGPSHYLLNAGGVDVVSGTNREGLLPPPPATTTRGFVGNMFVVAHKSPDGRFWFVAANPKHGEAPNFLPYYLIPIGVTAVLCWLAAVGAIWPIRRLSESMRGFGRGDLAMRAQFRRRDEIGALARSFNEMADRIERLVISERRLLQDISHELRSPLARLKMAIKLARTAPDQEAALDRVERDVDRIAALTAELVEMARMEGEPRALQLEKTDLGELVKEAVHDCRADAPRDFIFEISFTGEISCDCELLRRALENVLRNAIRHSPEGAPIEVAIGESGAEAVVVIRDFGPGVPDDALEKIFAPFYRVDDAREAASGGLGLGLAIARGAVHLHGGTISAHNAHPGLRVEISLPR